MNYNKTIIWMAVNGGLFEKAGQAVGETQNEIDVEKELANGSIQIGGVWYDSIDDYLNSNNLPSAPGTKPYLPGSNFSQVTGTDLSTGLVIKDNVGNEYVWIEVPNNGTGPDYSSVSSSTDYDNIETALRKYASKYISPAHYDEWYDGNRCTATGSISSSGSPRDVEPTGTPSYAGSSNSTTSGLNTSFTIGEIAMSTNLEDTSGCGLPYVQYTSLKHQMLTSIYKKGGFWIGRYEAGIPEPRTEHSDVTTSTTIKALSQQNQYPLNYVYCSEAQTLASKVATDAGLENHTTSLMFGIQWDLLLTYLEKKGTTYAELAGGDEVGSTNWGNYSNNLWTISNTSAKYVDASYGKSWLDGAYGAKTSGSILLSTGADLSFSKMNIYDLAGNVWEWTLEHSIEQGSKLGNARGGCMINKGNYATSCTRMFNAKITDCERWIGFRVTIY